MPARPTMNPPVGKSGPGTSVSSSLSLSSRDASRCSATQTMPSITSRRLCGGMFVAMPDRDAGRAVHQQVRKRRGQDGGLFGRLVVVGYEVDRLAVEIGHQVVGERLQLRLGVAHRRRRVAVDRSEVPLAVDQRIAHVEALRQADERVVDGRVAVRVEVAHHLADDLGALAVGPVRRQPHRAHAVDDAPVRRLQPVAHVGQGAADDDAHGVVHVGPAHLVFDGDVGGTLGAFDVGHGGARCPGS